MKFLTFLIAVLIIEVIQSFKYSFNRIPTSKALFTNIDSTLGTPSERPFNNNYVTQEGVTVTCEVTDVKNPTIEIERLISSLDNTKGRRAICNYLIYIPYSCIKTFRSIVDFFLRISWTLRTVDCGFQLTSNSD